jgi:hypothetical protein
MTAIYLYTSQTTVGGSVFLTVSNKAIDRYLGNKESWAEDTQSHQTVKCVSVGLRTNYQYAGKGNSLAGRQSPHYQSSKPNNISVTVCCEIPQERLLVFEKGRTF